MEIYLPLLILVISVLCRPTVSDHDSGEIDFGDSDASFYNPYEYYSQSKLTGGQMGSRTISPSSGQFVGQSDDKEDVQYVYVSPSGGQMIGQNTGQFNSQTLGSPGGQIVHKSTDSDDQFITIVQPNSQAGWQAKGKTGKTVYTPSGLFTNLDDEQFVTPKSQSAGKIGVQNVQSFIHPTNMAVEIESDQYVPTGYKTSQHGSRSIVQSAEHGYPQSQTVGSLSGKPGDIEYVFVGQQTGQNINGQPSGQNTISYTVQTSGQSNDKNDVNDDRYLPVGSLGDQAGLVNGQPVSQNTVSYTIQSTGQSKDRNIYNGEKYVTVDQLKDQTGLMNSPFVGQNTVPHTIQSAGQSKDKTDKNDDNYLTAINVGGQAGLFNGQLNNQFASPNVPFTVQTNGQSMDETDKNDDNYLTANNVGGQAGLFNGQLNSQFASPTVPFTVQTNGQSMDKTDTNDDNYLTARDIGGQARLFNGQLNGQFANPNVVPFTVQTNGQTNDKADQNDDTYLAASNVGSQAGVFNSPFSGQSVMPYTIQSLGQSDEIKDDRFVFTGQSFTQTSGSPMISINSDDDDDDDDDDDFMRFGQLGGQVGGQFSGPSFSQGGGNILSSQSIVPATVHISGSSGQSVGQTVGQTHRHIVDQPVAPSVVHTSGQFVSGGRGHSPVKAGRLSIGQYPGQRDDHPDSMTTYPTPSYMEKDVDAGGMCDNYKTKGGWAYRPIYGSCNQYLQCNSDHMASLLTCAAGTFYDGTSCRHSAEVFCPYDPCQARESGFKYTDGQSCYGYYKCVKGKSRYHTCPDGFYFNSHKQICISDETCQKNNLIHPCSYGTTYPFPGRPEMFYLYDGREIFYPMKCPKGLWYRPDICSCDWIVPGISSHEGCKPMYHFRYNGNFLEAYNRIQQVPNTGVAIYRKSALFSDGGQIMVWAMNNMNLDKEFAFCFEFMAKVYNGEVALLSNGYKDHEFTYKITYLPAQALVKAYIELDDGTTAHLVVDGVIPLKPHFVRLAKYGSKIKLRIDNIKATMVKTHAQVQTSNSPLVIGAAQGCKGFVGHFDEFKFFKCVPNDFFNDYAEKKK